jgi:hypothetical protein
VVSLGAAPLAGGSQLYRERALSAARAATAAKGLWGAWVLPLAGGSQLHRERALSAARAATT